MKQQISFQNDTKSNHSGFRININPFLARCQKSNFELMGYNVLILRKV